MWDTKGINKMRDKKFYNDKIFVRINSDMKEFVNELSLNRDNTNAELGQHHVIHDAICLLYKEKKGKVFKG